MTGEPTPPHRDLRMSDADRERVVAQLNAAVGEGRLTIDEFTERVDGVLRSRTFGEIEPYVADLPAFALAPPAPAREVAEIRSTASSVRRGGRWHVPRRLVVRSKAGSVILDFTEAAIAFPVVHLDLDVVAGSTTLVLPPAATVDTDNVEMIAGSVKVRGVPSDANPALAPHFVVTGTQKAGSLVVRYQRRFWRWRW